MKNVVMLAFGIILIILSFGEQYTYTNPKQYCLFDVLVNSRELQRNFRIFIGRLFQQASLAGHMGEYQLLFMLNSATLSRAKQKFIITGLMLCNQHIVLPCEASSGMAGAGAGELQCL